MHPPRTRNEDAGRLGLCRDSLPHDPRQRSPCRADAPVTLTFNRAADYATKLNQAKILRHGDWRLPTKDELSLLFKNRDQGALKGTFNSTGSAIAGWYWSSTPEHDDDAWSQRFTDGVKANLATIIQRSVRCVRSTPRP